MMLLLFYAKLSRIVTLSRIYSIFIFESTLTQLVSKRDTSVTMQSRFGGRRIPGRGDDRGGMRGVSGQKWRMGLG